MKLIAVTQRVAQVGEPPERRDTLDQRWLAFLSHCGFVPLLVPNHAASAAQLLSQAKPSGILLTGGDDLVAYGGTAPERDEVERLFIEKAISAKLPLLGVCRGMQALQHFHGVKLGPVPGHVTPSHGIVLQGRPEKVNSYHRLGTKLAGGGLEIWGTAEDGVVEAVRHFTSPLAGIMWHPERVSPCSDRDVALFRTHFGDPSK